MLGHLWEEYHPQNLENIKQEKCHIYILVFLRLGGMAGWKGRNVINCGVFVLFCHFKFDLEIKVSLSSFKNILSFASWDDKKMLVW